MLPTKITSMLNIQYPVIQAAMTWITSAELVSAVSNAGGLGVLGPNAGQTEQAMDVHSSLANMRTQIRRVNTLTNKPFALNYILPTIGDEKSIDYAKKLLAIMIEEQVGIAVVIRHGADSDLSFIDALKAAGIKILFRDISPTVKNALAAEKLGIDALIITGYEAGGYLTQHGISTMVMLSQVIDAVKIPVIAAGGIYNAKTAQAAFAIGAQAVYMGTRFINTVECPASQSCKEAIIAACSEDLVVIANASMRVLSKQQHEHLAEASHHAYIGSFRRGMLLGDLDKGIICVSESAGGIHDIVTCQALIEEIIDI